MSLYDAFLEECVLIEKRKVADPEGGWTTQWEDGVHFKATIEFSTSIEARRAQAQGVTSAYTVTTPTATKLEYHDVFQRVKDGKVFRATSDGDDKQTPAAASAAMPQMSIVTAEEWALT